MSALRDKLLKNSTIKETAILESSILFEKKDMIQLPVPMLNVAFSGDLDGGMVPGLTTFAGESKRFKSLYLFLCMSSYLAKYPEAVALFWDSEFGTPKSYFDGLDIPKDRVIHTPITNIEELKFDSMQQLEQIKRGDKVFLAVDSIGNAASKKEVEDALKGNAAADMSRAKQLKSLFRMVTPHLTLKDIPMVVVNHTYKEQGMFPKDIVSGGTGSYYSSDNIFIIGRSQEKERDEQVGWNFTINVEKSRYVKEKSRIPITVTQKGGINKWSGLLENAIEAQFLAKTSLKPIKYSHVDQETGEIDETSKFLPSEMKKEFWAPIITHQKFKEFIKKKYQVSSTQLLQDEDLI